MRKRIAIVLAGLLLVACALSGCSSGENITEVADPEPVSELDPDEEDTVDGDEGWADVEWSFDTPENHGVNAGILEAMHIAVADEDIYSILTVKDGVIIDEYYKEGYDENSVFRMASCSKSFTSALVGIAIDEGFIDGVDVSIAEYFPQLSGTDKEAITVRHLLEHTSGIEWYEWNGGTSFGEWRASDNRVEYVLEQQLVDEPGTTFNYSTGGPHLLAAILQQATGVTAYDYAVEQIFKPLGMRSAAWASDDQGVTDGGNGISMTPRDAAKFGQLYLDGGRWNGEQIIPEAWVEQSTSVQSSGIGRSGQYGYQWWIRPFGDAEYDTYYAMGHAGQFIFVVPELQLVTVITSSMSQDTYAPWPYFTDYILAACE